MLKTPHPVFERTLCIRQMRDLQSQGIHALSLSCNSLMKLRTVWSTVDPLQAPLDARPEIRGALCLWRRVEHISIVEHCGSPEIKMCSKCCVQRVLSYLRNKQGVLYYVAVWEMQCNTVPCAEIIPVLVLISSVINCLYSANKRLCYLWMQQHMEPPWSSSILLGLIGNGLGWC